MSSDAFELNQPRKNEDKNQRKKREILKLHFLAISSIFPSTKHPSSKSEKPNAAATFPYYINNQKNTKTKKTWHTWIFWRFLSVSDRLARSATIRNRLRGFLTTDTADLHRLRASSEARFGSTSKFSLKYFSIDFCPKTELISINSKARTRDRVSFSDPVIVSLDGKSHSWPKKAGKVRETFRTKKIWAIKTRNYRFMEGQFGKYNYLVIIYLFSFVFCFLFFVFCIFFFLKLLWFPLKVDIIF